MNIDILLEKRGLKWNDLEPEEKETLFSWMGAINNNELNVGKVKDYVEKMRDNIAISLTQIDETPNNWISLLCFLIPLLGLIKKWYLDQKRLLLTARLKNYTLMAQFLESPDKAKKALENAISNIPIKGGV